MTAITDQVLWRRVLNHIAADLKVEVTPFVGTRVRKHLAITNGTAVMYTAGGTVGLYLCGVRWSVEGISTPVRTYMAVRNVANTELYLIYDLEWQIQGQIIDSMTFWPPDLLPVGYDIYLYSSGDEATTRAFIYGYEV